MYNQFHFFIEYQMICNIGSISFFPRQQAVKLSVYKSPGAHEPPVTLQRARIYSAAHVDD